MFYHHWRLPAFILGTLLLAVLVTYFSTNLFLTPVIQTPPETTEASDTCSLVVNNTEWSVINGRFLYQKANNDLAYPELAGTLPPEVFITHLASDGQRLFYTDCGRRIVGCISLKTFEQLWESGGEESFLLPDGSFPLSVSPEGDLWVANPGKKQLEQLLPKNGNFLAKWQPLESVAFPGCCNPILFQAISNGRFICAEKGTNRIRLFSPSGAEEKILADNLNFKLLNRHTLAVDESTLRVNDGNQPLLEISLNE